MPFIRCLSCYKSDVNNVWVKYRGNWRKRMHNVEFHNLYCLSDTGVSNKSGKMGLKVILKRFLIGNR